MIYLDTSVTLAHLLGEDRRPRDAIWKQPLVSSRLLEYESWTQIHTRGLSPTHSEPLRSILARIAFLELARPVLERALEPFPVPMRTLDALHFASILRVKGIAEDVGQSLLVVTSDQDLLDACKAEGIEVLDPEDEAALSQLRRLRQS